MFNYKETFLRYSKAIYFERCLNSTRLKSGTQFKNDRGGKAEKQTIRRCIPSELTLQRRVIWMRNYLVIYSWPVCYSTVSKEETFLQDFLEEMFPWYYIDSDVISKFKCITVAKGLIYITIIGDIITCIYVVEHISKNI